MSTQAKPAGLATALALLLACLLAPSARAAFGFESAEVAFANPDGTPALQAGSHPYLFTNNIEVNTVNKGGKKVADGDFKDLRVSLPPGLVADPYAVPRCPAADFLNTSEEHHFGNCPDSTAVGWVEAHGPGETGGDPGVIFNLEPPPGVALKLGFHILHVAVTIEGTINPAAPHNALASLDNVSNAVEFGGSTVTIWGNPADPSHDEERGECLDPAAPGSCPVSIPERPFLTLPRSCTGPLLSLFEADSWQDPGTWVQHPVQTDPGMAGCSKLGFSPTIAAQPTSRAAQSPTGLDFALEVPNEGLRSAKEGAVADSDIERAEVVLPEGMTINPSQAEGLEVCTEADLDNETLAAEAGQGCPEAAKIGTIEVETPLLEGTILKGSLFVAEPYANLAGDSLIAFYIVIKDKRLGILVKQPARVDPDPRTGQLITTTEDMPQLPFSHFRLRFREGARSPLVTPPGCGAYEVRATFHPSSGGPPLTTASDFEILTGPGEGPCPAGGTPPFEPGFGAGTLNNAAGRHSPFALRLTRRDGDQDLVRFDATLPPGVVAKLAGVGRCSDAEIAQLQAKTGKQELANPSCPASSKIGTVQAGAGVGSQLVYVPGSVYLAGPFGKAPLSVVGVVPAVAGPFDVGVVSTRQALTLDPVTAEVKVDGSLSEPIPHILAGIPLSVRDVQVNVERPNFTLNPTNCSPMAIGASIWGGGLDPFSLADDSPVARSQRFQAADCAALGFKPRLAINLKGGTKRGGHPALKAVLTPRPGDANLKRTVVKLPRSAFLDQAHIGTICTRVQWAQRSCPKGSIYGHVTAFTPLLDQPLQGNAYLRSSDNLLPDLVFDLRGIVDIEASARIDSVRGGIRATFAGLPDAPVSKVLVNMAGGKKGLIVNSRNLCAAPSRAEVKLGAHNGRRHASKPVVRATGCKKRAKRR